GPDRAREELALALVARGLLTRLGLAACGVGGRVAQRLREQGEVVQAADALLHNSPRSANDTTSHRPTTRWSSTRTSMICSAVASERVRNSSARDGSATPDGWLWARITAPAPSSSARLTTSRGYTLVCVRVPRNMVSHAMRRFCASRNSTA